MIWQERVSPGDLIATRHKVSVKSMVSHILERVIFLCVDISPKDLSTELGEGGEREREEE